MLTSSAPLNPKSHEGNLEDQDGYLPMQWVALQKTNTYFQESTNFIASSKQACFFVPEGDITWSFKVAHCSYNPEKQPGWKENKALHSWHTQQDVLEASQTYRGVSTNNNQPSGEKAIMLKGLHYIICQCPGWNTPPVADLELPLWYNSSPSWEKTSTHTSWTIYWYLLLKSCMTMIVVLVFEMQIWNCC